MMDRTGGFERDDEEERGEHVDLHGGEIERKRIYDLISLDGWMLPALWDHFLLHFISDS